VKSDPEVSFQAPVSESVAINGHHLADMHCRVADSKHSKIGQQEQVLSSGT